MPEGDDEDMYRRLGEDFDNYDNQVAELSASNDRYKKDQEDLLKAVNANKDNGRYLEGMMNGEDFLSTAIGIHGYDGLIEYLQSEEAREKYREADEKHKAELAKSEELNKEAMANAEQTEKDIQQAIDGKRFTEEEFASALEELYGMADGLELNVCKPEWIEMVLAARNRDNDVAKAREEGRKQGVTEGLEKNLKQKKGTNKPQSAMPVNLGGRTATEKRKTNGGRWGALLG